MSVKYVPVQWNSVKWKYNFILLTAVVGYIIVFLVLGKEMQTLEGKINFQILAARAFGSLAFFMMSFILCIGPLARLDNRFLPLLYNRRHFGVMTLFVAITHAGYVLNWYYGFSAQINLKHCSSLILTLLNSSGFHSRFLESSHCFVWQHSLLHLTTFG